MSEKELSRLKKEIENLESSLYDFSEKMAELKNVTEIFDNLTNIIHNKFIVLNENLNQLMLKHKNDVSNTVSEATRAVKEKIGDWQVSNSEKLTTEIEEVKQKLSELNEKFVALTNEGNEALKTLCEEIEDRLNKHLDSHILDVERLTNNQVNTLRKTLDEAKEYHTDIKSRSLDIFQQNVTNFRSQLETNINISENIITESIEHLRAEYRDKFTENMEKIFGSFERIKSELGNLVNNAIEHIKRELAGVTETMDKYLIAEIVKIQDVLSEYEKGMEDLNKVILDNFIASKDSMLSSYDQISAEQITEIRNALEENNKNFNSKLDIILDTFEKETASLQEKVKTTISIEKEAISKEISEIIEKLSNKSDLLKKDANNVTTDTTESVTTTTETITQSLEQTTRNATDFISSKEKELLDATSNLANSARAGIEQYKKETSSELNQETKEVISSGKDFEKTKASLLERIKKVEENLNAIKQLLEQ